MISILSVKRIYLLNVLKSQENLDFKKANVNPLKTRTENPQDFLYILYIPKLAEVSKCRIQILVRVCVRKCIIENISLSLSYAYY